MLKLILILVAVALVGFLAFVATRPDSFRIERSARIAATPEQLHGLINDFRQFNRWNPWRLKDPATTDLYGTSTVGVGARYGWESKELGVGSMEIVESTAGQRVLLKLDFIKPFEAHNRAEFTLQAEADGATTVRWSMEGPANFMSKLMNVVVGMEKMVGPDFEAGLANLKKIAEQRG
ncbi:SRPBCC family protein [Pelomonas sp. V22]|uniref:SRPBCC family protein n=1 Tax=Pelomonas sp. V22 TaxID=2822139 RepID=UPI0024A7DB07|nr:SRPBCC family protein [Pelomonas sp. V22]MDI4635777.1 SRPBCC family protein [Pelomonas sp. V22]